MINIFSKNLDQTTDRVIEYIRYLSPATDIYRIIDINYTDVKFEIKNNSSTVSISAGDTKINIENSSSWLRRGFVRFQDDVDLNSENITISTHLNKENELLKDYFYFYSNAVGDYSKELRNNRMINYNLAKKAGFLIPPTLITNCKKDLLSFFEDNKEIICKPIHSNHLYFEDKDFGYSPKGTVIFSQKEMMEIEEKFPISMFQAYIKKDVEIRVFFLKKKIYPMAIFSQLDIKTTFDFRNYNDERPNRNIPFKFESREEKKIKKFIKLSKLSTGSLDIILTPDNEFYFLEVNPTGQFGWVSENCNYYLEKCIAKVLIKNEQKNSSNLL